MGRFGGQGRGAPPHSPFCAQMGPNVSNCVKMLQKCIQQPELGYKKKWLTLHRTVIRSGKASGRLGKSAASELGALQSHRNPRRTFKSRTVYTASSLRRSVPPRSRKSCPGDAAILWPHECEKPAGGAVAIVASRTDASARQATGIQPSPVLSIGGD